MLKAATEQLATIAGQQPSVRRARKSIAAFKLREGMPVGVAVTLRGERGYEFLDRLVSIAIPRIRDFRGLNPRSFDGRGNYSMGVKEQIIFPEIDYDAIDQVRGLDITITTTAAHRRRGLRAAGGASACRSPPQGRPKGFDPEAERAPSEAAPSGAPVSRRPPPTPAPRRPPPRRRGRADAESVAEERRRGRAEPWPRRSWPRPRPSRSRPRRRRGLEAAVEPEAEAEPRIAPRPQPQAEPRHAAEAPRRRSPRSQPSPRQSEPRRSRPGRQTAEPAEDDADTPRRRAPTDGQDFAARQAGAHTQVQDTCLYSLHPLRPAARGVPQVRGVPHLPARARPQRPDPRDDEVLLVGA